MPKKPIKLDTHSRKLIYRRGQAAKRSRKPMFINPFIGVPARIWSMGHRGDPLRSTVKDHVDPQLLVTDAALRRMSYAQLEEVLMGISRPKIAKLRAQWRRDGDV